LSAAFSSAPQLLPRQITTATKTARAHAELSVVIVNYRNWEQTAFLVEQLRASYVMQEGRAEVVIVDNHSPAHPIAGRLRRLPGVSLCRWERNHGFARAANEGCRLSRGSWFLLLNPDVTAPEGFLDDVLKLGECLQAEEPRVGILGFGLQNSDGSPQRSAGPFPSLGNTLARLALPRKRRKYHWHSHAKGAAPRWVTGCCVLVRRECFRELGGFDEDFFLYYEDVDLCRRALARGWTVREEPALRVVHHHPLHQRKVPPHLRLCTRHALLTYSAKHWPGWQHHLLAGIVKVEAWWRRNLAYWQGRSQDADAFCQLNALAGEFACGQKGAARKRLVRLVRRQETASDR
jgi:N-acetylglucosaminyl-diphospho-decaprenol L-rhamnosyltransferase